MALSLQQVQRQTQRLIMTPQMQQSIQLLQMNSMDLEQLIRAEMLENPFLEMGDDEEALESGPDDASADDSIEMIAPEAESGLSDQAKEAPPSLEDPFSPPDVQDFTGDGPATDPAEKAEGSDDFEHMADSDVDWKEQFEDSDTVSTAGTREEVEENDFTTYTSSPESLYDNLNRQLRLSILAGRDLEIGEFIIGNLNNDGYLDCSLPNLCLMVGYPPEIATPDNAGPVEKVDQTLRRLLARQRGGENPDAFAGMKRRELLSRVTAELVGWSYDKVAALKMEGLHLLLLAHRMKRDHAELSALPPAEVVLDAIAFRLNVSPDRVFDVLEIIHEFEPTGIAARDLAECLRLQCEEQGIRNRVLYTILDDHLPDLQQKRFREIARALDVPEEEITKVFHILSSLNPKPGSTTTKETPHYITPDVYVKKVDGKYMYFLNEGDAGHLKVAASYRRLIGTKESRKAARQDAKVAAHAAAEAAVATGVIGGPPPAQNGNQWEEVKSSPSQDFDYATERYKSAIWLIRNIEKRKSTILRVTESIMDYQKEFLEKGIEHLRPLTLRDIAERVGMHESTIARVTTKKYVETPRGIFELKYFFSSGLETDDGEAASSRSIKELLTQIIGAEERRRPLSDQKIADMLRQKGFQIARRTVAKYREQLKILPAKLRKQVN